MRAVCLIFDDVWSLNVHIAILKLLGCMIRIYLIHVVVYEP